MKEVVLASASERRAGILSSCGIAHRVVPSGAKEDAAGNGNISDIVRVNAARKAEAVAAREKQAVIIGADTLVACDDNIIGKPDGEAAARQMLKRFSGGKIEVCTGLCVMDPAAEGKAVGSEKSALFVPELTDEEVERYLRLLSPYDKAGGFSIEGVGSLIFDDIRGSYFNILGLPMMKLAELFDQIGLDIIDFIRA